MRWPSRLLWPVALCAAILLGCSAVPDSPDDDAAEPLEATWTAVVLPVPPGPAGRVVLRDVAHCGSTWYAVGGVFETATTSRPAWWSSSDGTRWTSRSLAPVDLFAQGSVLSSVDCVGDAVAAIGSRPGGAHGNLRTSSWRLRDDGVLVDVLAPFTQYGGVEAVNVTHVVGGPTGWTIAGNRVSGAAVWTSRDARDFVREDADPALRNDDDHRFLANDVAPAGSGWVLVGSAGLSGRAQLAPYAWSTTDGSTWEREEVPTTDEFTDLERVVVDGERLVALGLSGDGFGVWTRGDDGTWTSVARFGGLDPARTAAPAVVGLDAADGRLVATVSDGVTYELWTSSDAITWTQVGTPTTPPSGSGRVMTTATDGTTTLLLTDDERSARLWLTEGP